MLSMWTLIIVLSNSSGITTVQMNYSMKNECEVEAKYWTDKYNGASKTGAKVTLAECRVSKVKVK